MTAIAEPGLAQFPAGFRGRLIGPSDADYDDARSLWNADFDRRPALIARCTSSDDVAIALAEARDRGWEVAVRGGGHSYTGASGVDDGLVIDLTEMRAVDVDPVARRATVGGGATWADFDAATQEHGLASTGGIVSHTGVGGLTLGGGMGWLVREHGLAIDNLVAAEVVTADGRTLRTSAEVYPDLFWALRGGGGNFGVVTSFTFRLHPVGPDVHVGLLFWELGRGARALAMIRDRTPTMPHRTGVLVAAGLTAPPAPFVPEQHHAAVGNALIVAGFGTAEEHAAALAPFRRRCRRCSSSSPRCPTPPCSSCSTTPRPGAPTATTRASTSTSSPTRRSPPSPNTCRGRPRRTRSCPCSCWTASTRRSPTAPPHSAGTAARLGRRRRRRVPDTGGPRGGPAVGAGVVDGAAAPRLQHGRLRQLPLRARRRPGADHVRARDLRPTRPSQGGLRPGERLPSQRQHRTISVTDRPR